MRDIKRRRSSIQSTGQITRAMKLVATVKLQKAREKAEHTRPYSDGVYQTMQSILERSAGISHPYLQGGDNPRKAVIVMTSNRGLAGGYNANVVKLITQGNFDLKELDIYAVGQQMILIFLLPLNNFLTELPYKIFYTNSSLHLTYNHILIKSSSILFRLFLQNNHLYLLEFVIPLFFALFFQYYLALENFLLFLFQLDSHHFQYLLLLT